MATWPPMVVFEERLSMPARAWGLFGLALAVTFFLVHPYFVPFTAAAWTVNVVRFSGTTIRVDDRSLVVGRRAVPLQALDLATLGRARNNWPWRQLNRRYLGAVPIWTADSIGLKGAVGNRRYSVNVGTNRRDELVAILTRLVPAARARSTAGPTSWAAPAVFARPGWYPDPWAPVHRIRWWDGQVWTDHVAVRRR